jgi:hypothetical protein
VPAIYGTGIAGVRVLMLARLAQMGGAWVLGYVLAVYLARHVPFAVWQERLIYRATKWAVVLLAVFLPSITIITHLQLAPSFQQYAQAWDARHDYITAQVAAGASEVEVPPLPYDLESYIELARLQGRANPNWINEYSALYYAVPVYLSP